MSVTSGRPSSELIERILAETYAVHPGIRSQESDALLRKRLGKLLEEAGFPPMAAERRTVTVLVTELRGFDAVAERNTPTAVVNLFNRYLALMTEVIARHGGIVDKLSGQSLTVLFGPPLEQGNHAYAALACAAEMQQAMSKCNQQNEVLLLPPLYMGIGIHSGDVVMGAVGATLRREYTALGSVVAVAARIAAQSLRGQVLFSEAIFRLVQDSVLVGELNTVRARGRHTPVTVYEMLGTMRPRALTVPRRDVRKSLRVPVQMPCYFQRVRDSGAIGPLHCGQVVDMGYHGLRMISPVPLEASNEIKMALSLQLLGNRTSDIYARIVLADAEQQGCRCSIEFTDIDLVGRQTIKQFVDSQVCAM